MGDYDGVTSIWCEMCEKHPDRCDGPARGCWEPRPAPTIGSGESFMVTWPPQEACVKEKDWPEAVVKYQAGQFGQFG